ncbi:MAG: helix-turn-helix transcriptional regulator [Paracoccaceae bacterium]|jgi:transcriptional regulator with XRE-family HTH domain
MMETNWYSEDAATLGDRVTAARERMNMTQTQLAKRMGIQVSTLRGWENDNSEPRANRLSMMAGILNVSIMWLLNGEGEGVDEAGVDGSETLGILDQMRDIRVEMVQLTKRLALLEKRLREAQTDE